MDQPPIAKLGAGPSKGQFEQSSFQILTKGLAMFCLSWYVQYLTETLKPQRGQPLSQDTESTPNYLVAVGPLWGWRGGGVWEGPLKGGGGGSKRDNLGRSGRAGRGGGGVHAARATRWFIAGSTNLPLLSL